MVKKYSVNKTLTGSTNPSTQGAQNIVAEFSIDKYVLPTAVWLDTTIEYDNTMSYTDTSEYPAFTAEIISYNGSLNDPGQGLSNNSNSYNPASGNLKFRLSSEPDSNFRRLQNKNPVSNGSTASRRIKGGLNVVKQTNAYGNTYLNPELNHALILNPGSRNSGISFVHPQDTTIEMKILGRQML